MPSKQQFQVLVKRLQFRTNFNFFLGLQSLVPPWDCANATSDPCGEKWLGVVCVDSEIASVYDYLFSSFSNVRSGLFGASASGYIPTQVGLLAGISYLYGTVQKSIK